jgi:hypothetical protein
VKGVKKNGVCFISKVRKRKLLFQFFPLITIDSSAAATLSFSTENSMPSGHLIHEYPFLSHFPGDYREREREIQVEERE